MTNDIYPDANNDQGQSNENEPNRKFPDDDSNVGDNPIYPNEEDTIPVNENTPPEMDETEMDENSVAGQSPQNNPDQEVGSDQGGAYPYNINSNTAEDDDDEDANGIEPETGPLDTNKDQNFENSDQDSENSHI